MTELRPYEHSNITLSDYCTGNGSGAAAPCCLGIRGVGCLEIITYCCVVSMIIEVILQVRPTLLPNLSHLDMLLQDSKSVHSSGLQLSHYYLCIDFLRLG